MNHIPKRPSINPAGIPQELRHLDRWVVWRYCLQDNGRIAKVPLNPRTLQRADVTDPVTWGEYGLALEAYERGHVDGIGITVGDGLVMVDLDHCVDPVTRELDPTAKAIVSQLHTYTEYSPSGAGLHLLAYGRKPAGACRSPQGVEMYGEARYTTVTGHHLPGAPDSPQHRPTALARFHARHLAPTPPAPAARPRLRMTPPKGDQELLERMFRSRAGARIRALYEGDTSAYDHDASRADLALTAHLGYWTDYDRERMDCLFRASGLYRPEKWDARHSADGRTYGELTIDKACENQHRGRPRG